MKSLIVVGLIAVLVALGSAGMFMLRKRRDGDRADARMAHALAWRIGLSVALFLFILLSWRLGWITPGGVPIGS
jgi:hypothetical protein